MNRMAVVKELVTAAKELTGKTSLSANDVVTYLLAEGGVEFKANWTGAWDRATSKNARLVTVNVGKGFEKAVAVDAGGGNMIYIGPFELENEPSYNTAFLFFCADALYIKGL